MNVLHDRGQSTSNLNELELLPNGIGFAEFLPLFKRGMRLLQDSLRRLFANDAELKTVWQPGDLKISLRQSTDSMPGFLYCDGSEVARRDNNALFAAIGDRGDGADPNKFKLPDFRGRYIRLVSGAERAGSTEEAILAGGTDAGVVKVSVWVKT